MSGQPAARIGDKLSCTTPQATPAAAPHAPTGVPLAGVGANTVEIGGKPAARMGDFSLCPSPVPVPNAVIRGAFPVPIEKMPAARMTDPGTPPHVGQILPPCCPTVLIGLAGTAGNVYVGNKMCEAAKTGRAGNSNGQNYNNCGIESSRQLINQATGGNIAELPLLNQAINNPAVNLGNVIGSPGLPPTVANGGTTPGIRQSILANNGVPSTVVSNAANPSALPIALGNGQGAIASVDAAALWPVSAPTVAAPAPGSLHAITVTGMEYDDNGNLKNYIINDTGTGQCGVSVPASTMQSAMAAHPNPAQPLNITTNPIF